MSDNTSADDVDSANMFMSMLICDQGLVLSFHAMALFSILKTENKTVATVATLE